MQVCHVIGPSCGRVRSAPSANAAAAANGTEEAVHPVWGRSSVTTKDAVNLLNMLCRFEVDRLQVRVCVHHLRMWWGERESLDDGTCRHEHTKKELAGRGPFCASLVKFAGAQMFQHINSPYTPLRRPKILRAHMPTTILGLSCSTYSIVVQSRALGYSLCMLAHSPSRTVHAGPCFCVPYIMWTIPHP
eukprot:524879-Pelagomonas_calceolata.AAC.9